jgi:RNA polymerase sigma-70 factor (ECF subfamily)
MPEIKGLSREEAEILEKYYRAEYTGMLHFALHLLGDENLAELAVQDTFVTAARKMRELTDSPKPVGWLYNTLKNTVLHIRRERQQMLALHVSLDDTAELTTEMKEADSGLDLTKNEDLRLLKRMYIDGYSLRDLAKEQNITVAAMKMRLKRAKERLKTDKDLVKLLKNEK